MALLSAGMCVRDKIQNSYVPFVTWMIVAILFLGGEVRAANFYYDFLWSTDDNQYLIDNVASPDLILYENNNYIFTKTAGFDSNLTLTDTNDSNKIPLNIDEIFNNGLTNRKDYIHFAPNLNTPRELFYTNFDFGESSQNTGKIFIKEKTNLEFIMPVSLADEEMLGSEIHFDGNLNLFVSAPGQEGENGKVYFFDKNSSTYTSSNFVEAPSSGRTQFGGSLLSTDANLFIGAPDENSFRGAVYIYALNESGFASSNYSQLLTDSSGGSGDLFGWDVAVSGENLAISSPYAGSNNSGQVVLFEKEGENMTQNDTIFSNGSQSGDEFGYDIEFEENLLFVGAPGHDLVDGLNSGAVYIYQKSDGNWNETKISAPDFSPGDRFGHSLAFQDNLLFVGAEFGDGQEVDSGSVYIFGRVDSGWEFREELFPSRSGSNQLFSSQLKVDQNLLCVTAPGLNSEGNSSIYLFRMEEVTDEWELISSIDLDFFDDQERTKSSLAFKDGTIVLGNPNHNQQYGLVSGFFNPSWQADEKPSLHPIFSKSTPTILTVLEDEDSLHNLFEFEHPFDVEVSWSMVESNSSTGSFDLNSTTGDFFYYPETDFNGIHSFKLKASLGDSSSLHFFQVQVDAVDDDPYFTDKGNILPAAEDGSEYDDFKFPVFDADGDSLSVSLVSGNHLPPQMEISDNMLIGTPNVGNISASDYTFTVSLSDGNGGAVANHTYNLVVLPRNEAPVVSFRGDINSSFSVNLFEDFSPNDWSEILDDFNISDPDNYTVSLLEEPNFGEVVITESQGYFYYPPLNFHGIDKFKIRVLDSHPSNPKFTDLSIKVSIKEVNDVPVLLSSLPSGTAGENEFYEHKFEFWDPDIGDSVNLSFEGLPSWLVFDGNRTISGIPDRTDYIPDHIHSVKFKASDQRGGHFSEYFNLVVEPVNYPPVIVGADNQSFEITEDTTEHWIIELNATDFDTVSEELLWGVKVAPSNGELNLAGSGANAVISFLPDANFTGVDEFVISVYNEQDPLAEDTVRFTANVSNVTDPPVFLSQPYTVVLRGTPWDYKIEVFDPDPLEDLLIEIIGDLPEWIDYNDTQKLLSGVPPQSAEESFPIAIKVTDKNGLESVQSFSLNLVNSIELIRINEPQIGDQIISEDSNWSGGGLTVENVQGRKISWTVIEEPLDGIIHFEEIQNGKIDNLTYFPNKNFFGEDSFVIQASDGYSSEFRNFKFAVTEVADPPIFLSGDSDSEIKIEDRDDLNITVHFADGDGLETLTYEILEIPTWVDADFSDFESGKITLGGVPYLENVGVHQLMFRIYGIEDLLEAEFSLDILVEELNKPVTLWKQNPEGTVEVDTLTFWMMEDTPSSWIPPQLLAEDPETNADLLFWEIIESPLYGDASIDENGSKFLYSSDTNFSGTDHFVLGITDDGVEIINDGERELISSARTTLIPVKVIVQSSNDKPVILSEPITQWTDEYPFEYRLHVYDSDWPWQGYPQLKLISKLPSWATWRDDGNGSGVLSGQPAFWDEGKHFFSFLIQSGGDQLNHQFDLNIVVEDYPPLISKVGSSSMVEKVKIAFEEDRFDLDEWKSVTNLEASDPENAQTVLWSIYQFPSSGADLNLSSDKNKLSDIHYIPPDHFYGTDMFILKASEGKNDRFSLLPFEVLIKPIADPPLFVLEELPERILTANPGDRFEALFKAIDYDKERLNFKTFFTGSQSPSWFKELAVDHEGGSILLGGEPPLSVESDSNFSFTLVASDPTGRFTTTQHTVIYEDINFPPVIQDGDRLEIIFDENISTKKSQVFPIKATDANNDSLTWRLSSYHQPRYGDLLLIQEKGMLEELRYVPTDILPARDSFTLEVSDGELIDSIILNASFDHSKFLIKLPNQFPPLYEGQFFNLNFFIQDNNPTGTGYSTKLMQGPSWLTVNKVDLTNFEIVGEVPEMAEGTHTLSLKVTHPNGYDAQFATTQLLVKKKNQSSLKLLGLKELYLPVHTGVENFSEPGFRATDINGEDVSLDQVLVTFPQAIEIGRNVITYEYGEHLEERIVWGVANSPFNGITAQILLKENSLIAKGGTPFAEYILEPNQDAGNSAASSFSHGFNISKVSRGDLAADKRLFYQSTMKCTEINDFHYSNSLFYILGQRLEEEKSSIFLTSIGLDGVSDWAVDFELQGEVLDLKVTPSFSRDILLTGNLIGSIQVGTEKITSSSPCSFAILVDANGKSLGVSLFEQVLGKVAVTNHSLTNDWFLTMELADDSANPITKILHLDRSLKIISEKIISGVSAGRICSSNEAIFLLGFRQVIEDPDKNVVLIKLSLSGSVVWEKNMVISSVPNFLDLVDINYNSFGQINLSVLFSQSCNIMGHTYSSRGGVDAIIMALSHNNGELLWAEHLGGGGDDLITNQFSNESGVFGVSISTTGFLVGNDEVPSTSHNRELFVHFRSISQIPEIIGENLFEFKIDEANLHEIKVANQAYSIGRVHTLENWLDVINEDNKIYLSASPSLKEWLDHKDSDQTLILRIAGENNSYSDFLLSYNYMLPDRLKSSQSVIPPLQLVRNILGNAEVVKMDGNADKSFVGGNFKGNLEYDGTTHYSSARSSGFIYCLENDNFSLVREYILLSDESCKIVDLELDKRGNLYAIGNFSGKVQLSNRKLNASSGTDIFVVKIGSDGRLKEFFSLPVINDQKAASLVIGDDKIFICGSFTGNFVLGKHEVQSFGKSDGFIAQLDPSNLSAVSWIHSIGGVGYDHCNDLDWAKDSLVVAGDFSSSINLGGANILLKENHGSFCAKFSADGTMQNYYTFESEGALSAEKVSYDASDDSLLLLGEFSKEMSCKDSFLSSSFKEIFAAKFDHSLKRAKLFKFNGSGDKTFSDLHMTELGYAYVAGSFSGGLKLLNKDFTADSRAHAFLAKLDTSSLAVVDHFTLQSSAHDQINSVLNFTGNQLLVSGESQALELKSYPSYSANDPFLVTLQYSKDLQVGGEFIDIHPVAVGLPFKFNFLTFGWEDAGGSFAAENIDMPSWANVMIDNFGNGYLSGYSPNKEGTFPVEFKVRLSNSSTVFIKDNIVVIDDSTTPSLIIPKKVDAKQFEDFEVSFYVENVKDEKIRFSSNFPSWIEILPTNTKEFLLHGKPGGNVIGEHVFKLSVSTLAGLSDQAEISINVKQNIQTSLAEQEDDLNTWMTSWIGSAYILENGWAYHAHLRWIYIQPDQFNGAWIWTKKWDWLWTNEQYWDGRKGNFFSKNLNQWVFIREDEVNNRNLIYNYQAGKWYPF